MRERSTSRATRGFTLIELVCAMGVVSVLCVLASRVLLGAADQYMASVARAELCDEMSSAMERLTTELRQVRILSAGAPDFTAATGTSIGWNDASGAESVALSGTDLVFTDATASATILRGVTTFSVQTFDESDAALPSTPSGVQRASIRRVQLTITSQRQGVSETLRTLVFVRMCASGGGV